MNIIIFSFLANPSTISSSQRRMLHPATVRQSRRLAYHVSGRHVPLVQHAANCRRSSR